MTIGQLLCEAGTALRGAGIDEARREARLLLAYVTGLTQEEMLRDPAHEIGPASASRFRRFVRRRCERTPLAFLTGRCGFWNLELAVGRETLVPRPDSEAVVRLALRLSGRPSNVLDLGTGTGCLLLAVLSEYPAAWGVGVDLRPGAAALASSNAAANGLGARATFLAGSWGRALRGSFDLILSNPPYIETAALAALMPEVKAHEPCTALDGGPDGLAAYRDIFDGIGALLAPGGSLVVEIGLGQSQDVTRLAAGAGFQLTGLEHDFSGIPRALGFRAIGATPPAH